MLCPLGLGLRASARGARFLVSYPPPMYTPPNLLRGRLWCVNAHELLDPPRETTPHSSLDRTMDGGEVSVEKEDQTHRQSCLPATLKALLDAAGRKGRGGMIPMLPELQD